MRLAQEAALLAERSDISEELDHTFAVDYLKSGRPIERLSILLGHSSVKVTERHYSPWTKSRQEQLESDLRAMWDHQEQGTKQVQVPNPRPN